MPNVIAKNVKAKLLQQNVKCYSKTSNVKAKRQMLKQNRFEKLQQMKKGHLRQKHR